MSRLTRRELVSVSVIGGASLLAPRSLVDSALARRGPPLLRGGRFAEGVLSGDPKPTAITLLTRLAGVEGAGTVTLEIARDRGFDRVLTRSRLSTNAALGHAIKARVSGLRPHEDYWYRFAGRTADSPVGHFRTAPPPDSREPIRFGIFAGQDFSAGFFNAHERLAEEDLDFVLNLGSYISADEALVRPVREISHATADTLGEYRRLYREYRADPALREMHAQHAIVSSWDDGEVARGYAGRGDQAGAYGAVSRLVAYRAWFESMPHYPKAGGTARIHHRPQFGRLVDLFVTDTRQYRVDPPCDSRGGPACLGRGKRGDLLGDDQRDGLQRDLNRSRASWKLVATPSPVATFRDAPEALADTDGWQAYPTERESLLSSLRENDVRNVVFLSAGLRRFVAADVIDQRDRVIAPEFSVGSVSQRTVAETAAAAGVEGFGTLGAPREPDGETRRLRLANPAFRENDQLHHGYAVCTVRRGSLTVRFRKVDVVRQRSRRLAAGTTHRVRRDDGRPGLG